MLFGEFRDYGDAGTCAYPVRAGLQELNGVVVGPDAAGGLDAEIPV